MEKKPDSRFSGIKPFEQKVWLASPTMHGDEQYWVDNAIKTNWVSTIGSNIDAIEKMTAEYLGCRYAVALSCGTASLHLAVKLAGEKLYGHPRTNEGTLRGNRVFCSDCTFSASVNPVAYEAGEAVFIDSERDTWNMDPAALEKAFEIYPDVRLIIVAHLYGTPAKMEEIRRIADAHGALIIEDAAESFGAKYKFYDRWIETGLLGSFGVISFNGNKVITGSSGGMFLSDSAEDARKIRKWSTQSREAASWYQHEELGYNYRMSNIIAGVIRGQFPYLDEHLAQKRTIWERYEKGLKGLPVKMNPWDREKSLPNFWLSCMIINEEAMSRFTRGEREESWKTEAGKTNPGEILSALADFNAEGRPIWKPMHLQPVYRSNAFVTAENEIRGGCDSDSFIARADVSADIFQRGLCLPSDNKMTEEQQERIIEIIQRCFC